MRNILILPALVFLFGCSEKPSYKDFDLPLNERVELLLSEMTIEEKVQQMQWRNLQLVFDEEGNFIPDSAKKYLENGMGIAGVYLFNAEPEVFAKALNELQKFLLEETDPGIPAFIYGEGLHGLMAKDATVFPQAIALASSWDTAMVRKIYDQTAVESRVRGVTDMFSPVVGLGRDPRWGRVDETYGEDPFLVAHMGKAAILGFQGGTGKIDEHHVVATAKHYAVHSQPEDGTNSAPGNFSERVIRENFLYPFEVAVKEANVRSVMATYNEVDGIPMPVNTWLLQDIARDEWAFDGFMISDLGAMENLVTVHAVAEYPAEAARRSLEAGVDAELISRDGCFPSLVKLVKNGTVSESLLDRAAGNVLRAKFELGLFENPYVDLDKINEMLMDQSRKDLAQKAAEESMVLLKNNNNILPLESGNIKRLAVIGPNAAEPHFGGYSTEPREGISILEGFNTYGEGKFEVLYSEGCKISLGTATFWDGVNPVLNDPADDRKLIASAVQTAKQADAIVLVIGGNESTLREGWSENHRGDRDDLNLLGLQEELASELIKTGKPVIVLLINGRPLTINYLQEKTDAIIECWYPGEMGGHAAARIVFGEVNPSGKLPITFPVNVGQLPVYYNKKPSINRSYLFRDSKFLYPFGHGLSYTEFEYSELQLPGSDPAIDESFEISFTLKNTGKRAGKEVVQLYIRDEISSVTRPVKELKGFDKVWLEPGESKEVIFTIKPELLQFYNTEMKRVVEPGWFNVMIGSSSEDIRLSGRIMLVE